MTPIRGWDQQLDGADDLQALSDAAREGARALRIALTMLTRAGITNHETYRLDQSMHRLDAALDTLRAATPVVPEGLREALSGLVRAVIWMKQGIPPGGSLGSEWGEFLRRTGDVNAWLDTAEAALAASPSPDTACDIEPAFSQHEYAVDYCETHDRPADQCIRPADTADVADRRLIDAALNGWLTAHRYAFPASQPEEFVRGWLAAFTHLDSYRDARLATPDNLDPVLDAGLRPSPDTDAGLDVELLARAMANETDSATEDERREDLWSLFSERIRDDWRRRATRVAVEYEGLLR